MINAITWSKMTTEARDAFIDRAIRRGRKGRIAPGVVLVEGGVQTPVPRRDATAQEIVDWERAYRPAPDTRSQEVREHHEETKSKARALDDKYRAWEIENEANWFASVMGVMRHPA